VTAEASALEARGHLLLPQRLYAPPPPPYRRLFWWHHSRQRVCYQAVPVVVLLPVQVCAPCGSVEVVALTGSGGHG
jgi:hypothetical protein